MVYHTKSSYMLYISFNTASILLKSFHLGFKEIVQLEVLTTLTLEVVRFRSHSLKNSDSLKHRNQSELSVSTFNFWEALIGFICSYFIKVKVDIYISRELAESR